MLHHFLPPEVHRRVGITSPVWHKPPANWSMSVNTGSDNMHAENC